MRKREITEEGKTWAGDISEVDEAFLTPLRRIVRELNWTGGGELEMVRDADGRLWLLEWNPRFPAWVHGATIAGVNLPALLVEARPAWPPSGRPRKAMSSPASCSRCPCAPTIPLPPCPSTSAADWVTR
jgi:hypothetical protein